MIPTVTRRHYALEEKREMLGRLANVARPVPPHRGGFGDPQWAEQAAEFIKRYEALRPHSDPELEEREVVEYAARFREAWKAQEAKTEDEMTFSIHLVNGYLDEIFGLRSIDAISGERPVVRANFAAGALELVPRNLLEVLALQLMSDREKLIRCGCPECHRYLVKHKSRDTYCDFWVRKEREFDGKWTSCGPLMRRRSQYRSRDEHSDEINRRRRKPPAKKRSNK